MASHLSMPQRAARCACLGSSSSNSSSSKIRPLAGCSGGRSAPAAALAPRRSWQRSTRLLVRAAEQAASKGKPKQQMLVYVPPHPLVKHWLAVARNAATPSPMFRSALAELGRILIYEAVRDLLPTTSGVVQTPLGEAEVEIVDPLNPVKVVPILRAGLVLLDQAATVLPSCQTYHLGYVRDERTLQPTSYLNKLPDSFDPDDRIVVTDPMLATGGTMMKALEEITARGADPSNIRVVSVVCAPPALKSMADTYPGLKVYTAIIDAELSDRGFIIPGLGDAGDRAFGTA